MNNDDFVITGSTALYFYGIISDIPNDLDVIIKTELFDENIKYNDMDVCNGYNEYFNDILVNKIFECSNRIKGNLIMLHKHLFDFYSYLYKKYRKEKYKKRIGILRDFI